MCALVAMHDHPRAPQRPFVWADPREYPGCRRSFSAASDRVQPVPGYRQGFAIACKRKFLVILAEFTVHSSPGRQAPVADIVWQAVRGGGAPSRIYLGDYRWAGLHGVIHSNCHWHGLAAIVGGGGGGAPATLQQEQSTTHLLHVPGYLCYPCHHAKPDSLIPLYCSSRIALAGLLQQSGTESRPAPPHYIS